MARLDTVTSAQYLYAGALMWLIVIIVALVLFMQAICGTNTLPRGAETDGLKSQPDTQTMSGPVQGLMAPFNVFWTRLEDRVSQSWVDKSWDLEETPLRSNEGQTHPVYGTLPTRAPDNLMVKKVVARLFVVTTISMVLLWIAQWLFWVGFLGLSMEEYVLARTHKT
ncbi:hypothetical protein IG631_24129 [Alternaria alternata]|nr:hypothetical protein IG631_24129 [Alternaria alternata]